MLFGTDGIRDKALSLINNLIPYKIGKATASRKKGVKICVAFDVRTSCTIIERQFIDGVVSAGGNVVRCGLVPTPCLAYLTHFLGADYGAMISASHNPPEYNGIKLFDGGGNKLTLEEEQIIEDIYNNETFLSGCGNVIDGTSYQKQYIDHIIKMVDCDYDLTPVTLDCCYGATSYLAPKIFKRMNAKVYAINNAYDGNFVNVGCGATHIDYLLAHMKSEIGFAFDGDGDRVIGATNGQEIDGDVMLYHIAKDMIKNNKLNPNIVVGTILTNSRLVEVLEDRGVSLVRADVGDKYVLDVMKKTGAVLGGEQAGHIIIKNDISTGDGILCALKLLKLYKQGERFREYVPYPQVKRNYSVNFDILDDKNFINDFEIIKNKLYGNGRCILRKSGTEPVIRVLIEGKNLNYIKEIIAQIDAIMVKYCQNRQ